MPQKYTHDENAFIERNTAKCILCGLCVRSCREVMDIHAIGLMGRGFTTEVSPAFALPLDQTKCNNCGLCVQLCPTGALTEKSCLTKQVPLDENYTEETVEIGGRKASVLVSRYDGKVLRVIPNDEISRNTELDRVELAKLVK
jgi:formate dehydrogenase major subunit